MKALDGLRAAGATVVFDDSILPDSFAETVAHIATFRYVREGTNKFLAGYGPAQYHSADEYRKAVGSPLPVTVGSPLPVTIVGGKDSTAPKDQPPLIQAELETDPEAGAYVLDPRRQGLIA